jgi:NAD(P)H dehydrogenase (quinone)
VPLEAVEQSLREMGMGEWFPKVMRDYSKAYSEGWGEFTTDDVERVTGHAPRSFDDFAHEVLAPALSGED